MELGVALVDLGLLLFCACINRGHSNILAIWDRFDKGKWHIAARALALAIYMYSASASKIIESSSTSSKLAATCTLRAQLRILHSRAYAYIYIKYNKRWLALANMCAYASAIVDVQLATCA